MTTIATQDPLLTLSGLDLLMTTAERGDLLARASVAPLDAGRDATHENTDRPSGDDHSGREDHPVTA